MDDSGAARLSAGAISARIDRLPATRTIWTMIALLGFGMFFELYDLLFSAYVAPSLVKSGVLTARPRACSVRPASRASSPPCSPGSSSAPSSAAFLPTATAAGRSSPGRSYGTRRRTSWWRCRATPRPQLWRLVSGVGLGLEMVTIGAYLSELAPKGLRGRAFAVNQAIGFVCVPVISFLAYMLVPRAPLGVEGWRWVVLIGALAAPIVVFLRRGLPESPRWLAKHGRLVEADHVLSAIEKKVAAEYGRPLPSPLPEEPVAPASHFVDLWFKACAGA